MISGFTIIRNAVKNDYPIVEAITSILPVVNEMVVLIGDCNDGTEELIRSIGSPKIKIHHSVWNTQLQAGGVVLAEETNKAFQLIDAASTWAFYIQADEVVHEKYYTAILDGCRKYKDDKKVQGLLFKYLHFYGTYQYIGDSRRWYSHEVRIIRNDKSISAYRDAQGFRIGDKRLDVAKIDAWIYHYGWVKSQEKMIAKMKDASNYWIADQQAWETFMASENIFSFDDYDSVAIFTGTHPQVMRHRIKQHDFDLKLDVNRKKLSLKNRIMYFVERVTGKRFFEFKNYRVIR